MRIFGFKSKRLLEWFSVVREEGRTLSTIAKVKMVLRIILAGLLIGRISGKEWRHRMKVCPKCPIFDKTFHRCRPYTGSPLGCGCWTPGLALEAKHCWGYEHLDGKLGW